MIEVENKSSEEWLSLRVTGHAGYAERGKDIVCAGVSAITGALAIFLSKAVSEECAVMADGDCSISCPRTEQTEAAFFMAQCGYRLLAERYPANIQVIPPTEA